MELEDLQNQLIEKQNSVSAMLQDKNIEISSLEAQIGENARILQELEQAAAEAARKQQEAAAAAAALRPGPREYPCADHVGRSGGAADGPPGPAAGGSHYAALRYAA